MQAGRPAPQWVAGGNMPAVGTDNNRRPEPAGVVRPSLLTPGAAVRVCRPVFAAFGFLLLTQATFCGPAPAPSPAQPNPPAIPAPPPVAADERLTVDLVA